MRILLLSWRDPEHPRAGGAETFTYEVARRLVAAGDEVEWFTASFPGASANVDRDGIRIIRRGHQWTVQAAAWIRYRTNLAERFDVVVDEVNTIPFFSPLWSKVPQLMLIFQLAREVWWYESRFPLSALGYALEPLYLQAYRRSPAVTISTSTHNDLRNLGFEADIDVVPIGIESIGTPQELREEPPAFLYVGRIAPSKRLHHLLAAFSKFVQEYGPASLWLVGSGSARYQARLTDQARRLGISGMVHFYGRVPIADKYRMMGQATALLMASAREGWGLVVTEANACGTPAIVYDVPGLRDAVRNEETGLIVAESVDALACGMLRICKEVGLRDRLAKEATAWSESFSFDQAADLIRRRLAKVAR